MTKYFMQLYGDIDDLCNSRILEELDYYMYDVKTQKEMIFYFTKEQSIFLILSDDTIWTIEKLQTLCRTALRENCFFLVRIDNRCGYMDESVWVNLKDTPEKFFNDPKAYRISLGRGSKLTKLLSKIKRIITPKTT